MPGDRVARFAQVQDKIMKTKKLSGKVAVVTGASKGIGAAIAKHLAAEGASVVVNYASSKTGADKIVAEITSAGGKAVAVPADVAKKADIERLFAETKKAFGRLDVLVNNAGIYEFSPLENVTEEHFHKHFNLNVLGVILASQAAVRLFDAAGGNRGDALSRHRGERDAQAGRSADAARPHWAAAGHRERGGFPGFQRFVLDHGRNLRHLGRLPLICMEAFTLARAERNRSDAERPAAQVHAARGVGRVHCAWHWRGDPIPRRTRVTCFGGKKMIKTRELD